MRIVEAAIKHNSRIYTGMRHHEIMRKIRDYTGKTERITQEMQGFMTDTGLFVNRWQAGGIAYEAGQTKTRKNELLSEDLW